MGKQKAPAPPNPVETSKAQTGTSVATAIANSILGNVNQVGADGSTLTYDQTGSFDFTDPYTNETYTLPNFTATQSLSDGAQDIYDAGQDAELNLAETARDQSNFLQDYLSKPFAADTGAIEQHLFDLASGTVDKKYDRQLSALETQLSNQGLKRGTDAYNTAISDLRESQNQGYNDLALRGRGQAFSELQAQRNQPINEITALLSGSQVSMPNYGTNQPSQIPTTDNAGLINNNYAQRLAANQYNNSQMGGLFGGLGQLAGTLGSAFIMSDERTKTDIKKVGKTDDGDAVYTYRYKSGGPIQMGVMAQKIEKRKPEAVKEIGGIKHVDYGIAFGGK